MSGILFQICGVAAAKAPPLTVENGKFDSWHYQVVTASTVGSSLTEHVANMEKSHISHPLVLHTHLLPLLFMPLLAISHWLHSGFGPSAR